jgi:hypothetical protein
LRGGSGLSMRMGIDRQQDQQEHDNCDLVFVPQKPSKPSWPRDFVVDAVHFGCAPHYGLDIPQPRFQPLPQGSTRHAVLVQQTSKRRARTRKKENP